MEALPRLPTITLLANLVAIRRRQPAGLPRPDRAGWDLERSAFGETPSRSARGRSPVHGHPIAGELRLCDERMLLPAHFQAARRSVTVFGRLGGSPELKIVPDSARGAVPGGHGRTCRHRPRWRTWPAGYALSEAPASTTLAASSVLPVPPVPPAPRTLSVPLPGTAPRRPCRPTPSATRWPPARGSGQALGGASRVRPTSRRSPDGEVSNSTDAEIFFAEAHPDLYSKMFIAEQQPNPPPWKCVRGSARRSPRPSLRVLHLRLRLHPHGRGSPEADIRLLVRMLC